VPMPCSFSTERLHHDVRPSGPQPGRAGPCSHPVCGAVRRLPVAFGWLTLARRSRYRARAAARANPAGDPPGRGAGAAGGQPGADHQDRLLLALSLTIEGDQITGYELTGAPARLRHLDLAVLAA